MKKILLTAVLAIVGMAVKAQVYVGGEAGFWRNFDDNKTSVSFIPEVGYELSDQLALGIGLGGEYHYLSGEKVSALSVNPYVRYKFAKVGIVKFFTDAGANVTMGKFKPSYGDASHATAWKIGLRPGMEIAVAPNLSLITHVGFLGYSDYDRNFQVLGEKGFGFSVASTNLAFGVEYHF